MKAIQCDGLWNQEEPRKSALQSIELRAVPRPHQLRRRREAILEKDHRLRTFVCDGLAEGWTPEQIAKAGHERGLRAALALF